MTTEPRSRRTPRAPRHGPARPGDHRTTVIAALLLAAAAAVTWLLLGSRGHSLQTDPTVTPTAVRHTAVRHTVVRQTATDEPRGGARSGADRAVPGTSDARLKAVADVTNGAATLPAVTWLRPGILPLPR
ncbi:hypothetical protein [Streptomyces sp. NPDC052496]|uniref:hypothetical protein n=1 Tax=Streptomyces sp. NPDC052496 TaxID=3154951 RepID=UPI0034398E5A